MANEKDLQLVQQLIEATQQGRIRWDPTARLDEFTSSFKGRFSIVVGKPSEDQYVFRMLDESEREMLNIEYEDSHQVLQQYTPEGACAVVMQLFEAARRQALHVNEAIDDILQELKSE